jgi:membrane-bound lytic murein transglycosylase MltF
LDALDQTNTQLFLNDVGSRLPDYVNSFNRAAAVTGLSWQLLAAVGYQESHWDPGAISPTGVRGIMMLTSPTAIRLGIHNRENPHLSIIGGARYLAMMLRKLPGSIQDPDRLWMALAAYNVGYGHVMDARRIVKKKGGDPNSWADVRKVLPLLNQRRYYHHTQFGYANGMQAVQYVAHIKDYYHVLMWRTAQNSLPAKVIDPLQTAGSQPVSQ